MRYFIFTYKDLRNKYNQPILKRKVTLSKSVDDIGTDAKNALGVFMNATGNLKKNEIIEIQEIDKDGNFIGEPIKPMEDVAIIPTV